MFLDFEKWHGCRNDFIVTWIGDADGELVESSLRRQAVALCDRRAGIGADGILILRGKTRDALTPDRLAIINSDGSLAANCGNGLRVAALSVLKRHREKGEPKELPEAVSLTITTDPAAGEKVCRFLRPSGAWPLVAVEMGVARTDGVPWKADALAQLASLAKSLGAPGLAAEAGVCEIGNPHLVVPFEGASRELVLRLGPAMQAGTSWSGLNVHLVHSVPLTDKDQQRAGQELGGRLGELFRAYVWERGAGETEACGSGACAVAACSLASGLGERDQWIAVDMPGGRLYVKQDDPGEPVLLAGPGVFVYSGKLGL